MKFNCLRTKFFQSSVAVGSALTLAATLTGCSTGLEQDIANNNIANAETDESSSAKPESKTTVDNTSKDQDTNKPTNVVYIILDDMGYSDIGSFGSEIKTPNIDALAESGLRYNNFNACPFSSATRASLLSGRENNSVGMGHVANLSLEEEFPNFQGKVSKNAALITEILKENDFNTYGLGKWHIAPVNNVTPAGPYDYWPIARGFDRYYGFLDGETDQYNPNILSGNEFITVEYEDGYTLNDDLTDRAIQYITDHVSVYPEKSFFMNFAFGTAHSPQQVPPSYSDAYKGVYDVGWDVIRQERFERQKELGIIPEDAMLSTFDENVQPWDTLNTEQKKLYTRFMEVYAGYISQADEQVGKIVDHLKKTGIYDDTLIVLLCGDNGASGDGGPEGTDSFVSYMAGGRVAATEDLMPKYNLIGTEDMQALYPKGWGQASNTPFSGYKGSMSLGALRNGLIVTWPNGIEARGQIRNQYVHVADITPTVLDLFDIESPTNIKGVDQMPMYGVSIADTFDSDVISTRSSGVFYKAGSCSYYKDGWRAVTQHIDGQPFEDDVWELYNVSEDYSECNNLADENPEKLEELKADFMKEVEAYNVLPFVEILPQQLSYTQKGCAQDRVIFKYYRGMNYISPLAAPAIAIGGLNITVPVTLNSEEDQGVLVAMGDDMGGYSLYIKEQKLNFAYNKYGEIFRVTSSLDIPVGQSEIKVILNKNSPVTGVATLLLDDQEIASGMIMTTFVPTFTGLSIGKDEFQAADPNYKDMGDFDFTGDFDYVQIEVTPFIPSN